MGNMTGREILGIYASQDRASYCCVKKGIFRFKSVRPAQGLSSEGDAEQGGIAGLREILSKIRPYSGRKIFLALPRSLFFVREIKLPLMPAEDAIASVESGISIYSHLPHEEIYYDIFVTPLFKDNTRCLFLYAEKKIIDRYRDVFRETGHFNSLVSVFPISYGICAWMQSNDIKYPAGVFVDYGKESELSVFDGRYWLSSVTWDSNDRENNCIAFRSVIAQFPEISDNLYRADETLKPDVSTPDESEIDIAVFSEAKPIDGLCGNLAAAAVAPSLCKIQQISIDEKPVKVNFIKPMRYIIAVACIIALVLFYMTGRISSRIKTEQQEMIMLKKKVEQLQKKIAPVQNRVRILKKAASVKEDAELFLRLRPDLYKYVNEIARLVPEGTWFSGFYFYDGVIHLNAYSEDALMTVKRLRKSKLFSKVRIKGPVVNRGSNKKEQFRLELTLNTNRQDNASQRGRND